MDPSQLTGAALKALAVHLAQRRPSILSAWRRAVDRDPELTTASTTTHTQFIDHIPAVLEDDHLVKPVGLEDIERVVGVRA